MSFTPNWGLIYLDSTTHKYVSADSEQRNWMFLDSQLYGLTTILGNGVISGWVVAESSGLIASIGIGSGFVSGYYAETVIAETLTLPASSTVYIYAVASETTPVIGDVSFVASIIPSTGLGDVLLATVVTDGDSIVSIDNSGKFTVGWSYELQHYLDTHVHDGNPIAKINLSSHVTGVLDSSHIGTIDASKITGLLDASNIPQISHTALQDIGRYTHAQIDLQLDALADSRYKRFGDILSVVMLQELIAKAHIYYEPVNAAGYFRYVPNTILIIPGITTFELSADTPNINDLLDYVLTTATVDELNHVFESSLGTELPASAGFSKTWNATNWLSSIITSTNIDIDDTITLDILSSTDTREISGTITFVYDTGRVSLFSTIEWELDDNGIDDPISVRARSANTESGLSSAPWSDPFDDSGVSLPVEPNRWVEIEITLQTDDVSVTPELDWVEISYYSITAGCGRALWPTLYAFELGTLVDAVISSNSIILDSGGSGTYESTGQATSDVISLGSSFYSWESFTWDSTVESGVTVLAVYYRTSTSEVGILSEIWNGPYYDGVGGVDMNSNTDAYIQFQLVLSTLDTEETPVLDTINIVYSEIGA